MDSVMGRAMPLYRDALTHSTTDEYWQRILFSPSDFAEIDVPALTVTGWFDGDQPGAIHYWEGMRAHSPARDRQYFLSGAWSHGETRTGGSPAIGQLERTSRSIMDIDALALSWFDHCLKQETRTFDFPRARVFLTGVNEWRDLEDYPPPTMEQRRLYLHSAGNANTFFGDGTLTWSEPADEPSDGYLYNPRNPVPSGPAQAGEDQRVVQRRDDVLVYTTEVLEEPLTMLGRVWVVIHASTDARDTDFMAKLTDVYPDGRALRLGATAVGVIRARYREGRDREVLVTPGRVEEYRIELFDMGHTFLPGHRGADRDHLERLSSHQSEPEHREPRGNRRRVEKRSTDNLPRSCTPVLRPPADLSRGLTGRARRADTRDPHARERFRARATGRE